MEQNKAIAESNYSITKQLVMDFANCVDSSMSLEARARNRQDTMEAIQRHVDNDVLRAELASMYNALIAKTTPDINENMCWKKYVLAHEGDKSALGVSESRCHRCGGFGIYDTDDPQATTQACPDYERVKGKI